MACTLSSYFNCSISARTHRFIPLPRLPNQVARFHTRVPRLAISAAAASAAGNPSNRDGDFNPYEILGVNPFVGFDKVKRAYTKKRKEAERAGDDAAVSQLEKAYDELMMSGLMGRMKGVTYGSLKVSEDIKYADKQPILPWGPRFARSSVKDMRINFAISAAFTAWTLFQPSVEYKALQFLAFSYVYRLFEKLKSFEPAASTTYTEDGVEDGRALRIGKRAFRSLSLVFGCIAFASLAYTGSLNLYEIATGYVPAFLYNNQEPIVTVVSAILLCIVGCYYR